MDTTHCLGGCCVLWNVFSFFIFKRKGIALLKFFLDSLIPILSFSILFTCRLLFECDETLLTTKEACFNPIHLCYKVIFHLITSWASSRGQ
jgi:hypothetical protein